MPGRSDDYARIINEQHFHRLTRHLGSGRVMVGGVTDEATRYIAPTILDEVPLDAPVIQEEIFGPILPVLEFG